MTVYKNKSVPFFLFVYVICIIILIDIYGLFGVALGHSIICLFKYLIFAYFLGYYVKTFSTLLTYIKLVGYTLVSFSIFYSINLLLRETSMIAIAHILTVFVFGILSYTSILYIVKDKGLRYIINILRK